jgi:hypothetical protein
MREVVDGLFRPMHFRACCLLRREAVFRSLDRVYEANPHVRRSSFDPIGKKPPPLQAEEVHPRSGIGNDFISEVFARNIAELE